MKLAVIGAGAIGNYVCSKAIERGLSAVTYTGRKSAVSWRGTLAEESHDLEHLNSATLIFSGSTREASSAYPKNANVAAAVALAGLGFDSTRVQLIADPLIDENVHEVEASGEFGQFTFRIVGRAAPDNPKTSALAAMSVISSLEQETQSIRFY